ncbi:GTP-binding protein Rheb isoform X1 [Gallus gallus]|uniref:GTP-binding protein Rheb isoform X1 n=2 Tax=Gallus gallus TaxID=9031 RepID=UPI001AE474F4|nr:GTP-binding protein Rheb isoform X1 [Gallus gallus]
MFRITRGWKLSCCREIPLCCRRVLAVSGSAVVTHSAQRTCNNAFFFSRDQKRLCERRRFLDAVYLRCCVRSSSPASGQGGGKTVLCLYGAGREQPAGGKSSLTIQFVEGQFVDSYDPTIENKNKQHHYFAGSFVICGMAGGSYFLKAFTKLITVNGQEYHLQLVDTAGQDEYSIFPQTYSIDINGYILVYSVTSIKSFEVIKVIHGKLLDMVGKVQIPIMLVGNKKDLHMERVISYEEGKALAESWNAAFLESSAKENQTAVDVFKRIILEAEKIDGAASQGKSSCSVM